MLPSTTTGYGGLIIVAGIMVVALAIAMFSFRGRRGHRNTTSSSGSSIAIIEANRESGGNSESGTIEYMPNKSVTNHTDKPFTTFELPLEKLEDDALFVHSRILCKEICKQELLHRGPMYEVHLATFKDKQVVVKQLTVACDSRDDPRWRAFMVQVRRWAMLRHPKVVQYIGMSYESVLRPGVVGEYLAHGDLGLVLANFRPPSTLQWLGSTHRGLCKLSIAMDVAEALSYLHYLDPQPLLHRHLVPETVLLSDTWEAKLSNFSRCQYSLEAAADATSTAAVNDASSMAPEVLQGYCYTEKADIYALGAILRALDQCEPQLQPQPAMASGGWSDDCPPEVVALAQRCLVRDPTVRPNALEVFFELRKLQHRVSFLA